MRTALIAALFSTAALPALADSVSGEVLAYDRVANLIVLEDKTVWSLETLAETPQDLAAGKLVTIDYTSNADNGWQKLNTLTVTN